VRLHTFGLGSQITGYLLLEGKLDFEAGSGTMRLLVVGTFNLFD
jgi:hypothetical protein